MNKSNLSKETNLTNREVYLSFKEKGNKEYINSTVLNTLLNEVNGFKSFSELILNFDKQIKDFEKFNELFEKVNSGYPLAYTLGKAPFIDLDLKVNKSTLIPRPETEELVTKAVDYVRKFGVPRGNIYDCCTGSGAVALAMKKYFPDSNVYASDISKDAIEVAKENSKNLNLDVTFFIGNKCNPIINSEIKIDIFLSNPPYVEKMEDIDENVKKYEPLDAIYIENGVEFYEDFFKNHKKFMKEHFMMGFEINYDQEEKLTELVEKYFDINHTAYSFSKDFYGKTRFLFIFGGVVIEE